MIFSVFGVGLGVFSQFFSNDAPAINALSVRDSTGATGAGAGGDHSSYNSAAATAFQALKQRAGDSPHPISSPTRQPEIVRVTPPPRPSSKFLDNAPAINPHAISGSTGQAEIAQVAPPPRPPSQSSGNAPVIDSPPASASPNQPQADPATLLLRQAIQLLEQKQLDAALDKANAALQSAPQNPHAYSVRGGIYAEKKLWDQAEKDYQTALQFDGKNTQMKFNLAELQFMQQKYDAARPGFIALGKDSNMGDLAAYKVFLCDLFGAHEEAAAKDLEAFNQAGSNASYYFANAAWSLYHHKTEDGRGWLMSALKIYDPPKFSQYAASLIALGYIPLPPPPQQ